MSDTENINKTVFKKMIIGGIIISLVTGFIVFCMEYARIDKYVAKLAVEESDKCAGYYGDYFYNRSAASLSILKQALRTSLDKNLFVLIEVYDDQLNKIICESIKGIDQLKKELHHKFADFIMTGKPAFKRAFMHNEIYIKVMSPIRDKNKIIGHLEGVYHISRKKFIEIRNQIFLSVIESILIVLITTILLYPLILKLHKKLYLRSCDLLDSNINTIKSLGNAIAKRDSDTGAHNFRVTIYSVRLAEESGVGASDIRSLIKGAFLHDVGKIGIRDNILLKPGKLTAEEFEIMKQHAVLGKEIIKDNKWLTDAMDIVLYHHEKFDGSGYPYGLKGEDIPLTARIFAIIDVFDALTSNRPYKKAFPIEKSLDIIKEGKGSHFDPYFIEKFEQIAENLYTKITDPGNEKELSATMDIFINKYFIL